MKEELTPLEAGKRKPFAVPDGYFADFATQFMEQPEVTPVRRSYKLVRRWAVAVAACAVVAVVTVLGVQNFVEQNAAAEAADYEIYMAAQLTDDMYYDYLLADSN